MPFLRTSYRYPPNSTWEDALNEAAPSVVFTTVRTSFPVVASLPWLRIANTWLPALLPLIFNKSPLLLTPLPSPTTSARIIKVLLPLRFSTFNVANVPAVDPWLAKSTVEWLSASVSRLELIVTFQTLLFIATSSFPPLTLSLREEPVQTDPGCISRLISPPLERTLPLISIRPEALMRLAA